MGSNILGTKIRRWREKNIKSNRTLYHTKRNGVGIWQGWCDCVGHEAKPCKILRDVLDIKDDELKDWNWRALESKDDDRGSRVDEDGEGKVKKKESESSMIGRKNLRREREMRRMNLNCEEKEILLSQEKRNLDLVDCLRGLSLEDLLPGDDKEVPLPLPPKTGAAKKAGGSSYKRAGRSSYPPGPVTNWLQGSS